MRRRILLILLTLIFISGICAPVSAADKKKVVKVGFFEMEGFFEKKDDGSYGGYGYDYVVEMAKYQNWKLEFVEGGFDELQYMMADEKTVDMMLGVYYYDDYKEHFDYSSLAVGTGCSLLTTLKNNDELTYEDYAALNGKRVGFLSDRYKCDEFKYIADKKNIIYTEVMYDTNEYLYSALESGDVDAIVANDVFISENEKLLSSFFYRNYYAITKKGNVLMNEIDEALEEISKNNRSFQSDIYEKNYDTKNGDTVSRNVSDYLTSEEKKYAASSEPVVVGISEYLITDEERGFKSCIPASIIRMYEIIGEQTGLKFEFVEVNGREETIKLLNNGNIDIIGAFPEKISLAEENNITLTNAYMTLYFSMVYNKNMQAGQYPTLSLVRDFEYNAKVIERNPNSSILYSDTYKAAVEKVNSGSAALAIINRYTAEELLASSEFNNVYSVSSAYGENLTCGISKSNDPILISIMSKSIACFSANDITEIIEANKVLGSHKMTVYSFVISHPILSIAFSVAFVLITVFLILAIAKQRRTSKERRTKDLLTGFCNMEGLIIEGQELLDANPRSTFVLTSINIKHFNYINSVYGLEQGNTIIKFIADALSEELSGKHITARDDSDDFIVIFECLNNYAANEFVDKLQEKIDKYEPSNKENYSVQIYAGSVLIPINRPKFSIKELTEQALAAQISIKNKSVRNAFFKEEMLEEATKIRKLVKEYSNAIENNEFHIFLQPVHSIVDEERIISAEFLTRWIKRDNTAIFPDEFISSLINCNTIIKLDQYVLDKACEYINNNLKCDWMDNFVASLNVANLCALQPGFVEYCSMIKKKNKIPNGKIALEFSESVVFNNVAVFKKLFSDLHKEGFICSIDNFGSGNSSLRELGELGADEIKLDRSLFNAYNERRDQNNEFVTSGILAIANSCGISTTAIGVDRVSQLSYLKQCKCQNIQGYIYSKPIAIESFSVYVDNFKPSLMKMS